jgi:S-formylglutathione hydrolase
METINEVICFGGKQGVYRHTSSTTNCQMEFSVYTPPQALNGNKVPVIWYLSGLTCTQDNATTKAGFQRIAAELGLMIVCPDTSPRGDDVADSDSYDLGQGAGFYLNATQKPWQSNFQMYDYIVKELPAYISTHFPVNMSQQSIMGHSMGGHGALTIALKNKDTYKSVSVFSPIVSPINCPWGQKALTAYLGSDPNTWKEYDACELLKQYGPIESNILIDQGLSDPFLESELKLHLFSDTCVKKQQSITLREHEGYDHSYFFIASFFEDHLRHHSQYLK